MAPTIEAQADRPDLKEPTSVAVLQHVRLELIDRLLEEYEAAAGLEPCTSECLALALLDKLTASPRFEKRDPRGQYREQPSAIEKGSGSTRASCSSFAICFF